MKNRIIIFLALMLILTAVPLSAATTVEVTEAIIEDISLDEIITGNLTPFEKANIPAQVGGVAEEVNIDIGDEVEAGSELIKMEQDSFLIQKRQAEAALESAEANYDELINGVTEEEYRRVKSSYEDAKAGLEIAEINYKQAKRAFERSEELFQDNIISKQDFEDAEDAFKNARSQVKSAETNLAVAEANLDEADRGPREEQIRASAAQVKQAEASLDEIEDTLSKTVIRAPFTGLVFERHIEKGEMIGSGQPIVNLINIDQLYVEIEITASAVSRINKGDIVEVKAETMQHYIEGEITNIAPQADPESRSFLVKVKIDNPDHSLRPGMFADVRLLKGEAGDAVVVPIESILDLTEETPYLYVVEDGKAIRREVEVGLQTDTQAEIISGLEAGESVIIRGQQRLDAEDEVEVINR
ncbi:efflux RND transporter periplasmic adaptor subunit [Halanaerobium hydrogeniformans]|uniref:Efflux transporter, RND family, MFP subunit n=1 Tax=Halanaerobium hydrogeniformans TaxID=656519 RepID=E4RN82_HALHG|nr:efflux RND transporter periplasmic adaptor subunit [Halanaerobium hydrogeniformans]ADQ14299.1 efflux transporter, RND family, MFP subunit [Halanaerobium hydrogeniformans]